MSDKLIHSLGQEKLQQLLAAIGSRPAPPSEQPDVTEYDWTLPRCFNTGQLAVLQDFAKGVAANAAARFSDLCQSNFSVTISSITEHFALDILNKTGEENQNDYYLTLAGAEERLCGFIHIPLPSAMAWAAQLLGDSETNTNPDRQLSELEESLLSDAAFAFIEAFSDSFENSEFQAVNKVTRELPQLPFQDTDELCRITFETKKADTEEGSTAHLVILSQELLVVAGRDNETTDQSTAEDASKAILNYLLDIPIVVTTLFASTTVTLEQAISLKQGDILLLDKKLDDPIELIVNDRAVLYGWPVQSEKRYAVVVAEGDLNDET